MDAAAVAPSRDGVCCVWRACVPVASPVAGKARVIQIIVQFNQQSVPEAERRQKHGAVAKNSGIKTAATKITPTVILLDGARRRAWIRRKERQALIRRGADGRRGSMCRGDQQGNRYEQAESMRNALWSIRESGGALSGYAATRRARDAVDGVEHPRTQRKRGDVRCMEGKDYARHAPPARKPASRNRRRIQREQMLERGHGIAP